jgi:hypothetical protein
MIVSGISPVQFAQAVEKAGALYCDNLRPEIGREYVRQDGTCQRFNARVLLKHTGYQLGLPVEDLAPGQKRSANVLGGQRRVAAVCWHVYRDVLIEVFNINPDAKVKTAYAKYYGKQAFYDLFPDTGHRNIGSMMYPVTPVECCDC